MSIPQSVKRRLASARTGSSSRKGRENTDRISARREGHEEDDLLCDRVGKRLAVDGEEHIMYRTPASAEKQLDVHYAGAVRGAALTAALTRRTPRRGS